MKTTLLNTPEDILWLKQTALKPANVPQVTPDFLSAVIHGNEDCPQQVDLYREREPLVTSRRAGVLVLNVTGRYTLKTGTRKS